MNYLYKRQKQKITCNSDKMINLIAKTLKIDMLKLRQKFKCLLNQTCNNTNSSKNYCSSHNQKIFSRVSMKCFQYSSGIQKNRNNQNKRNLYTTTTIKLTPIKNYKNMFKFNNRKIIVLLMKTCRCSHLDKRRIKKVKKGKNNRKIKNLILKAPN